MKGNMFVFSVAAMLTLADAETFAADRTKLEIGAYYLKANCRTEANIRDMKDCGIDFVIEDFRTNRDILASLEAKGMGVVQTGVIPPDLWGGKTNFNGNIARIYPMEKYVSMFAPYKFGPSEWMYYLGDELSALDFPYLGEVVRTLHKYSPQVQAYLNLHPCWHTDAKVRRYYGTENYIEHIKTYCREMPLDYICYDHYPYQWIWNDHDENWAFARYFENFKIVADACTETGRSFWFIPQVNTIKREKVEMTEDRLRYQAFAAMAYGAERLTWGCWMKGWWEENILDENGRKTVQYERLKKVNAEIRRFADDYMKYRRLGTHLTGFVGEAAKWLAADPRTFLPQVNFNEPDGASLLAFRNVRADDGKQLVVGDFVSRKGDGCGRAMLVFAAEDPFGRKPADRTVRFSSEHAVRAVGPHGEVAVEKTGDCAYAFTVRSSECVFVMTR